MLTVEAGKIMLEKNQYLMHQYIPTGMDLGLDAELTDVTSMVVYSDYATVYIINNEDWELTNNLIL